MQRSVLQVLEEVVFRVHFLVSARVKDAGQGMSRVQAMLLAVHLKGT